MFSLLALKLVLRVLAYDALASHYNLSMPNRTILVPSANDSGQAMPTTPGPVSRGSSDGHETPVAVIVGSAAGGVVLACVAVGTFLLLRRRRHRALASHRNEVVRFMDETRRSSPRTSPQPSLRGIIDIRALSEADPSLSVRVAHSNTSVFSSSAAPVSSTELSGKHALIARLVRGPPSVASASSNTHATSARSEVRPPPATRATSTSASASTENGWPNPAGEVAKLHTALRDLRREMLDLRADRVDLPPSYSTE
ncbi:hypothetical protein OH77DRAFT_549780 [Trametes cingulata]|nr:hypothetical protein OH77DRAFT_549780 [Trametes cingulata]